MYLPAQQRVLSAACPLWQAHEMHQPGAPGLQEKDAIAEVFYEFPKRFARKFKGKGHEVQLALSLTAIVSPAASCTTCGLPQLFMLCLRMGCQVL